MLESIKTDTYAGRNVKHAAWFINPKRPSIYVTCNSWNRKEESSYNQLLFFDFESTQEHGEHCPNLCIVHDEAGEEELFDGKDTVEKFCKWLFTKQHRDCIVIAHNFQGYDGYFIKETTS